MRSQGVGRFKSLHGFFASRFKSAKELAGIVHKFVFRAPPLPHWCALGTVGLVGFLMGLASAPEFGRLAMDGGVATLIGSALGAGITVLGSVWAARHSNSLRTSALERLVGEAVLAIRDDAHRLLAIAEIENWKDNNNFGDALQRQLEALKTTIDVFGQLSPFSDVQNYEARVSLFNLERIIRDRVNTLDHEMRWVTAHHTHGVLENARNTLVYPATSISEACVSVASDLGLRKPFPDEKEIERLTGNLRN